MRALFAGEEVTHRGRVVVDRARLWTRPAEPPPLIGAAVSEATARWAGVVGRRAGHGQRARRAPARRCSTPTARAAAAAGSCSRSTCRGRRPRRRRCGSPTTSGARTSSTRRSAGTSRPPSSSTRRASDVTPDDVRDKVLVSADLEPPRRVAARARRPRLRRDRAAPRRPGPRPLHRRLRRARPPAPAMSVKATSDLWWKNAIVYCLDVETFFDADGDGCGDLVGLTERVDYLGGLGVSCVWLMPFYPLGQPRRRLRHRRLLRRRPGAGDARRPRRVRPHRARPRHPRHRRLRHEPHLRPAPVVPVGAREPRLAVPRLLRVGRREARRRSPATSSSPTRRTPTGPGTRRPASSTCTASTPTSPTSTSPTRGCATSSRRSWRSGSSRACPASASTPCRS